MGLRFRKSKKIGGVRVNFSKSGIGYSVGTKGFRVTKKANGGTRTTVSAPGTGISYVKETGPNQQQSRSGNGSSAPNSSTFDSEPVKQKRHTLLWVLGWIFIFPLPLTIILNRKKNLNPILKYGIIIVAWILYLMIAFSGKSSNSAQKDLETRSISTAPVEQSDNINEQGIIEVESINILDAGESDMVLGEERQLSAEVLPDNADGSLPFEPPAGSLQLPIQRTDPPVPQPPVLHSVHLFPCGGYTRSGSWPYLPLLSLDMLSHESDSQRQDSPPVHG